MRVSILNGIYTDNNSDYRVSFPLNLLPVAKSNGISQGYLRPFYGLSELASISDKDRGGINWDEKCYRVIGSKFVLVNADYSITEIGDVGDDGKYVSMDYSFDHLCIVSNKNAFLYDGTTLTQITDADLGDVIDVVFIDGYFMFTDGEFLIVNDLTDPFSVNPLKYGSSESDPDNVTSLIKLRNEVYAVNRYTTEVFDNIGGSTFPFQRIEGAQIMRGSVGTHTVCKYNDMLAFLGSYRNEPLGVYLGANSTSRKISTDDIDKSLRAYTEAELANCKIEAIIVDEHELLFVNLPNETFVYDIEVSKMLQQPIWIRLSSSIDGKGIFDAHNFTWCYNKYLFGGANTNKIGYLSEDISHHWGNTIRWEFSTQMLYNDTRGAIINELELVGLTGRAVLGDNPTVWTQYSVDGMTWSTPKSRTAGKIGERNKRLTWFNQGFMRKNRIQRFFGTSDCHISIAALEITPEALNA